MRPKKCVVDHFGSYEHAEISFDNLGLTLISGPTGAGKSTIADFVCWTLFGQTSKQGSADDVRAWGSDRPTHVALEVELPDGDITVHRIRGKATQNDIWWHENGYPEKQHRGKDATETQRLLEKRLGVDAELFLLGSYFSQFSETDRFFTSKPRDRREVLERITDLSLAITLGEKASEARKVAKKELEGAETSLAKETGRQEQILSQIQSAERASVGWECTQAEQCARAQAAADGFEDEKTAKIEKLAAQIEAASAQIHPDESFGTRIEQIQAKQAALTGVRAKQQKLQTKLATIKADLALAEREYAKQERLPDTCPECKREGANPHKEKHLAEAKLKIGALKDATGAASTELAALDAALQDEYALGKALADLQRERAENQRRQDRVEADEHALIALDEQENPYIRRLEQLIQTKNPYSSQLVALQDSMKITNGEVKGLLTKADELRHRVASLSSIYDLSFALRGELLQSAVSQLQSDTNGNLSEYFDGVFSVAFTLEGSDKLQVTVSKDGHEVAYAQLSGGERRQLVLSFWRALSKRAWECAGVTSSLIVMDEAFSGLDDSLKVKAFRMLEDMSDEFESILVIDHSPAMQVLFSQEIRVEKQGETSCIEDVTGSVEAA